MIPSYQIGIFDFVNETKSSGVILPDSMRAGDSFIFEKSDLMLSAFIGGRELITLTQYSIPYFFGAIPFKHFKKGHLFILLKAPRIQFFLGHPRSSLYSQIVTIQHDRSPPSPIRLPAELLKKEREQEKVKKEAEIFYGLLNQAEHRWDDGCWLTPLPSPHIISAFGKPRVLANGHRYYHSGVDLRAVQRTPIRAPAAGQVLYAGSMIVPGKNVVLYHGGELYSRFLHLDEWSVAENASVKKGELIGFSGASGRAEGPHLHWEVWWNRLPINPMGLIATQATLCGPK